MRLLSSLYCSPVKHMLLVWAATVSYAYLTQICLQLSVELVVFLQWSANDAPLELGYRKYMYF